MNITAILNNLLPRDKYTLCIPHEGGVQRYECGTLDNARLMMNDWLRAGWPAYIENTKQERVTVQSRRASGVN